MVEVAEKKVKGTGHAAGQHGKGRLFQRGKIWWVQYYVNGQQHRESSDSYKKAVAEKLLMRRLVGAVDGIAPVKPTSTTYEEMRQRLVTYKTANKLGLPGFTHLDNFFGGMKAVAISEDRINEFIITRQSTGVSTATVNGDLRSLRQMFNLSAKQIKEPPQIKLLREPEPRQGFLTRQHELQLLTKLPDYVRPIFRFACVTGMRLTELKKLTWGRVDREELIIRLGASQTKNKTAREVPYGRVPELVGLVEQLWQQTTDASGLVFTRAKGKPLGSFYKAWKRACIRAGLGRMLWECRIDHQQIEALTQPWPPEAPKEEAPACICGSICHWKYQGLKFHDLRRTAVRNLVRAGVHQSIAMTISGHKDAKVFARYNVVDNSDKNDAMEKLEHYHREQDAKLEPQTVRPN